MNRTIFLLMAAALLSGCALVESYRPGGVEREISGGGGSAPLAAASGSAQEERLICTVERTTGSYMARRVCRTQAQIEAERESADEAMREAATRPGVSPGDQ